MTGVDPKEWSKAKLGVHLLVAMFGVTSWSVMNGLWVEFPILVSHLPEGWTLPSYVTIVVQFGNIGPITFSLLVYMFPTTKLEIPFSIGSVAGLSITAMLYAFFWRQTAVIFGTEYSVALLGLTLIQATCATCSSMSYLALMSHIQARYIGSLFLGMSLSGLVPAFTAIAQGVGNVKCVTNHSNHIANQVYTPEKNTSNVTYSSGLSNDSYLATISEYEEPIFSVKAFFLMISGIGWCSLCALLCLLYHPYCKTEHVDYETEENCTLMTPTSKTKAVSTSRNNDEIPIIDNDAEQQVEKEDKDSVSPKLDAWYLLFLQVWINMIQTSYVLAIQVYSSLPYGLFIYNAVTRTENIVDPIACIVSNFVTAKRTRVISGMTLLGTLFTAYIITVAAMSPNPWLHHEMAGGILVLAAWVMCTFFMVYAKVSIAGVMRSQGRKSLLWTGGSTQFGSFIGALLAYIMINHLHLFKDGPMCT